MKFPLDWHRDGLRNSERYLVLEAAKLARLQADFDRLRTSVAFRHAQLAEAERRGLDGYDEERLLVARRKSA